MTDDEMLETYSVAVESAMHRANERDGFASNMSRESRVAGLRAIERAAAARALAEVRATIGAYQEHGVWAFDQAVKCIERARAEAYRQEREEQ